MWSRQGSSKGHTGRSSDCSKLEFSNHSVYPLGTASNKFWMSFLCKEQKEGRIITLLLFYAFYLKVRELYCTSFKYFSEGKYCMCQVMTQWCHITSWQWLRHPLFYFTLRNNQRKSDIESELDHYLLDDSTFCMCSLSFKFPGIY